MQRRCQEQPHTGTCVRNTVAKKEGDGAACGACLSMSVIWEVQTRAAAWMRMCLAPRRAAAWRRMCLAPRRAAQLLGCACACRPNM
eukprot:365895-Chlamydomonas_euryale.AAC.9